MKTVIPKHRQSLADIALQTAGSLDALFSLAIRNNLSISEPIPTDTEIIMVEPLDLIIYNRYKARGVCPATEITPEDINVVPFEGIGFMGIEIDFIVN